MSDSRGHWWWPEHVGAVLASASGLLAVRDGKLEVAMWIVIAMLWMSSSYNLRTSK